MNTTLELHVAIVYYLLISSISIDFGDYLISSMLITSGINKLSFYPFTIN